MKKNRLFIKLMIKNKNNLYGIIVTFFILISFSFIFFELSSNNALKNDYISGYTPFTALSLFFNVLDVIALLVILLCSLTLIEVYEGFIEKNLKENSIFRACGYSSIRLSLLYCFLFIILCILIIPFALICGYILTCIIHFFLFSYLHINISVFAIDTYIFFGIFVLTLVLVTWVTLYTIGYFYRKNLLELLNEARGEKKGEMPLIEISVEIYLFVFVLGFISVIISLLNNDPPVSGIILICLTLKKVNLYILHIIKKFLSKRNPINIVAISECKSFLQKSSWFVYLYQVAIIVSSYVVIYMCFMKSDQIIGIIAYTVSSIFLASGLIYKYILEINKSVYVYKYCYLLGYSSDQILKIRKKTFSYIIDFVFIIPLIFQVIVFIAQFLINNYHTFSILYILILEFLIFNILKIIVHKYSKHIYNSYMRSELYD